VHFFGISRIARDGFQANSVTSDVKCESSKTLEQGKAKKALSYLILNPEEVKATSLSGPDVNVTFVPFFIVTRLVNLITVDNGEWIEITSSSRRVESLSESWATNERRRILDSADIEYQWTLGLG
jgi:hypothetical protein